MVQLNPFSFKRSSNKRSSQLRARGSAADGRKSLSGVGLLITFLLSLGLVYCVVILYLLGQPTSSSSSSSSSSSFSADTFGIPVDKSNLKANSQIAKDVTDNNSKERVIANEKVDTLLSNILSNNINKPKTTYKEWKELAVALAGLQPDQILDVLKNQDPFGVRRFEKQLLQAESDQQAILSIDSVRKELFPCPTKERITLPDQRNHDNAKKYRQALLDNSFLQPKEDFVFLFFQHLRKAGGTNFCGLAQHNLLKKQVPSYYCMPDMKWSGKKCAGCFTAFTNEEITSHMIADGHRILGNEWDPFDDRFFQLPAVFATSFRRPLDRALSQFRFECIEDRGCVYKEVEPWWKKRMDLTNVYTWTFSRSPLRKISIAGPMDENAKKKRQEVMAKALDTIAKYNLVLVMEWLAYAPEHVKDVLGFQDTTTMTERIRPHIQQARRDDGQEHNELGAAGIAKASWTPEEYLSPEQYKIMSRDLALDEILTDAARRMFLERMVCDDMAERNWA